MRKVRKEIILQERICLLCWMICSMNLLLVQRRLMMRKHGSIFMRNRQLHQFICKSSSTKMTTPLILSLVQPSALVLVFLDSQNLIPIYCLKDPRNVLYVLYPCARLVVTIQRFYILQTKESKALFCRETSCVMSVLL